MCSLVSVNTTVDVHCSVAPIVIPTYPKTPRVLTDPTTAHDNDIPTALANWYTDRRLIIIAAVVVVTLLVVIIAAICIVRRRRGKPGVDDVVCDKDWRLPDDVTSPEAACLRGRRPQTDSFAEVDTYIDEDGGTTSTQNNSDRKSSSGTVGTDKKPACVSVTDETTLSVNEKTTPSPAVMSVSSETAGRSNVKSKIDLFSGSANTDDPTGSTSGKPHATTPGGTTTSNNKPKGVYDNLVKAKATTTTDSRDNYVQPEHVDLVTNSQADGDDVITNDADEFSGLAEVPEYAEIEEMQMLLRKPPPQTISTTGTTTTTTPKSRLSSVASENTAPTVEYQPQTKTKKRSGFNCFRTKRNKSSAATKPSDRAKSSSRCADARDLKTGQESIKLANLDFSQLKDAIDRMEPHEVKLTMKKVSESPSMRKKSLQQSISIEEHIYTNTPPPKPPRTGPRGAAVKGATGTGSNLVTGDKKDDLIKYDSPRCSAIKADDTAVVAVMNGGAKADDKTCDITKPEVITSSNNNDTHAEGASAALKVVSPAVEIASPLAEIASPVVTSNDAIGLIQVDQPSSPRGKWGAPVAELYAQPERPSRLPRPTSPGPLNQSATGLQSPSLLSSIDKSPFVLQPPMNKGKARNKAPSLSASASKPLSSASAARKLPSSSTSKPPVSTVSSKPPQSPSSVSATNKQPASSQPSVLSASFTPAHRYPDSPSSPSGLTSLGLVVKATEALQSPTPQHRTSTSRRGQNTTPMTNAFNSAFNRFSSLENDVSSASENNKRAQDKTYMIALTPTTPTSPTTGARSYERDVINSGRVNPSSASSGVGEAAARHKQTSGRSTSGYDNVESIASNAPVQNTPARGRWEAASSVAVPRARDQTFVVGDNRRALWDKPDASRPGYLSPTVPLQSQFRI